MRVQSPPGALGSADFEELLGIKLAGNEDEPAPFLADEMLDHCRPAGPHCPQVRVDKQKGVVVAELARRCSAAA